MKDRKISLVLAVVSSLAAFPCFAQKIDIEIWCPDANDDGQVDFVDAQAVIEDEGPCPETGDCPADFNGNGHVGRFDLARVLGNWGDCRCPGDLDGNGFRDSDDVAILDDMIAEAPSCGTDIDRSGRVLDGIDFYIELGAWTSDPDSDPAADVDDSGGLSPTDVLDVFNAMGNSLDCRGELTGDGAVDALDRILLVQVANINPSCR